MRMPNLALFIMIIIKLPKLKVEKLFTIPEKITIKNTYPYTLCHLISLMIIEMAEIQVRITSLLSMPGSTDWDRVARQNATVFKSHLYDKAMDVIKTMAKIAAGSTIPLYFPIIFDKDGFPVPILAPMPLEVAKTWIVTSWASGQKYTKQAWGLWTLIGFNARTIASSLGAVSKTELHSGDGVMYLSHYHTLGLGGEHKYNDVHFWYGY